MIQAAALNFLGILDSFNPSISRLPLPIKFMFGRGSHVYSYVKHCYLGQRLLRNSNKITITIRAVRPVD
ncbi:hypothetical protein SLA2020_172440 [Shorea laevis]